VKGCSFLIHKFVFSLILLIGLGGLAAWFGGRLPGGFLPDEDQGYIFAALQLPNAASLQRTQAAAENVEEILKKSPGVEHVTTVVGFNMLSGVQNTYSAFFWVTLKEWAERKAPEEQYGPIKARISSALAKVPQGIAFVFPPPAIPGVGAAGGFTFILEDRSGKDVQFLTANMETFLAAARKRPELTGVFSLALPSVPQLFAKVDRDKALKQEVNLGEVYQTLQAFMGGALINYFNRFGRQWQVFVQAEGDYRTKAENVGEFQVRNSRGEMVPLSALTNIESQTGPEFTMRYNLYRAVQINGSAAQGYSSNDAMKALEEVFTQTMPSEMGFDYLGMSFQENLARKGVPASVIFAISFLMVFLILAALYESWSLPFSVLLSTPIAVCGALAALYLRRMTSLSFELNIYAQIGLVMLIGLAAKNAILIVEFAKAGYDQGRPLVEAALEGAKVRLRPILMTSFAFILGCVPLWTAAGAGAISRQVMGTVVIGGMLTASAIAIFVIPALFYIVEKLSGFGHSAAVAPPQGLEPRTSE
jgi:HAE1 family hydrophobic/amphiphilic exporter-1